MIRQARAQQQLAETEVEVIREGLDEAVIQTYFSLLLVRRSVDLANQQVHSAQTLLEATQSRLDAGVATEFELTRSELEFHQAVQELETTRNQFIEVRQAMAELLQTEADFDVDAPQAPPLPGEEPTMLIERAEDQRAAFQADSLGQEIAYFGEREVLYRYLPSLQATFSYGGSRTTALQPGAPQWTLTVGADWILWDGGIRGAERDQAQSEMVAAQIRAQQTRHQIDSEIKQALAELEAAETQLASAETQRELAERSLRQAETSFRHGVATQLDVINARDQFQLAQITVLQERLQVDLSTYRVLTLVGDVDQ